MFTKHQTKTFAVANELSGVQIFNQGLKSYRDLLKLSGWKSTDMTLRCLHGLLRVRAFTQDDAHILHRRSDYPRSLSVTNLILEIYKALGFENVILNIQID